MRQVTGRTNPKIMPQKMSIRLWSDGHSFPREQLKALREQRGVGDVEIELLSSRTTLVPACCFSPEQAESLLSLAGQPCHDTETAVWSDAWEGVVAVMAIDRATLEQLPKSVRFTSPLLSLKGETKESVLLARYENLLYIKVWDARLRLAEVIRVDSEEDLLYYLTRLGEVLPLRNYSLVVAGDDSKSLRKVVKKYFK